MFDPHETVTELIIGAEGWQHDQWIDRFYPDDLPQDWRFSFYCNEFQSVILTSTELSADVEEFSSLQDDCDDDFVFIAQLSLQQMEWQEYLQRLAMVQTNLHGILLHQTQIAEISSSQLQALVEQLDDNSPIYIEGATEEELQGLLIKTREFNQKTSKTSVNRVHSAENIKQTQQFLSNNTETELVLYKSKNKLAAKELREIMENCLKRFETAQRVCLFFMGDDVAIDNMRDATMIYHLMG